MNLRYYANTRSPYSPFDLLVGGLDHVTVTLEEHGHLAPGLSVDMVVPVGAAPDVLVIVYTACCTVHTVHCTYIAYSAQRTV